ncbi:hypothetical protein K378_03420 [Streptomyces sp. Amel2xB2]|nr:hypothetical protein K378_03420 [Streptomyces sp. Amel2xB2]
MRSHTGSGTGTPTEAGTGTGSSSGAGYRAVFRVREFRFVFAAHVLSLLGSVVAHVALPVLVYAGTSSALLSAVTFALGFLPQALGGALLARVADRFAARTVLVGCDLLCAACVGAMLLPGMPVAGLLALRAVSAFVQPLFAGVRAAGLGEILEGDAFVLGRSLIRVAAQAAQIAGFAATGLLLLALSPRSALLLTAGGFLASAALLGVGTRTRPPVAVNRVRGGTRVLFADRRVRGLLALSWLPSAFVVVPEGLAAPYADEIGAGSVGVGLLLTAMPVGAVAAELAAGSLLRPVTRERLVLPLAAVLLVPLLLFALRPAFAAVAARAGARGYGYGLHPRPGPLAVRRRTGGAAGPCDDRAVGGPDDGAGDGHGGGRARGGVRAAALGGGGLRDRRYGLCARRGTGRTAGGAESTAAGGGPVERRIVRTVPLSRVRPVTPAPFAARHRRVRPARSLRRLWPPCERPLGLSACRSRSV